MATLVSLMECQDSVVEELFIKRRDAEEQRRREVNASVKIQSWFRATKVRAYIKFLNHCARTIQRHFRGHKGREIHRQLVKEQLAKMRKDYYNAQATKIQKVWRGYYTRKFIHNFYSRKRYLEGLVAKSDVVRKQLKELAARSADEREKQRLQTARTAKEHEARKTHYLLSTHQIPGVYNSPFKPRPSPKEIELSRARPLSHPSRKTYYKTHTVEILNLTDSTSSAKNTLEPGSYQPLPPIKNKRNLQGPFRPPEEVTKQRHKPLSPTLRVATSYTSAEEARTEMKAQEWVTRLIDDKLMPFTRRDYPYEPLLHTTSAFGSLPYGTQHFREQDASKQMVPKKFETVVSPIPLFDRFGKTY